MDGKPYGLHESNQKKNFVYHVLVAYNNNKCVEIVHYGVMLVIKGLLINDSTIIS